MTAAASEGAMEHVRSYAASAETHVHDFHQVVLPLAGCLEMEIGGRGGRAVGRMGGFVSPGERHAFAASARNRFLVLDLPQALVQEAVTGAWLERAGCAGFIPISRAASRLASWFADEVAAEEVEPRTAAAFALLLLRSVSRPASRRVPGSWSAGPRTVNSVAESAGWGGS